MSLAGCSIMNERLFGGNVATVIQRPLLPSFFSTIKEVILASVGSDCCTPHSRSKRPPDCFIASRGPRGGSGLPSLKLWATLRKWWQVDLKCHRWMSICHVPEQIFPTQLPPKTCTHYFLSGCMDDMTQLISLSMHTVNVFPKRQPTTICQIELMSNKN